MAKLRSIRLLVTSVLLAAGVAAVAPAAPAGATAAASFSGDTFTITLTGAETMSVSCTGGMMRVTASNPVPASTPCTSVRHLVVNGDGGAQFVILVLVR